MKLCSIFDPFEKNRSSFLVFKLFIADEVSLYFIDEQTESR